jgi:hypothetical protein
MSVLSLDIVVSKQRISLNGAFESTWFDKYDSLVSQHPFIARIRDTAGGWLLKT